MSRSLIKQSCEFIETIESGNSITVSNFKKWRRESNWIHLLKKWFNLHLRIKKNNLANLRKSFDELEKKPVQFGKEECEFLYDLEMAERLIDAYKDEPLLKKEIAQLKQRIVALEYRLEKINGGLDPETPHKGQLEDLKSLANQWKRRQSIFNSEDLTPIELEALRQAARFPAFIAVLHLSAAIQDDFFQWILRDQMSCIPFIEFPALIETISRSHLNGRLACQGSHLLKIKKESIEGNNVQKIVTLPFEGRDINILDENLMVTFRGHLKMRLKEIFEVFKSKELVAGDLEFMREGIINWNIHQLGYWDDEEKQYKQVDVDQAKWWWQLPSFELLSLEQAKERYGEQLDGVLWSASASATRGVPSLTYEKTHAFMELAIPISRQSYAVFDFGKLAFRYPGSIWELMEMFCKNVHATVAYPDDNVYYSQRQHALHSFTLTPEQGEKLMGLIKEDIVKSRNYNFIYQIESENCAKWVQTKLEAILGETQVPNLYRMQLLDTEPEGPVSHLFRFIKSLPENWQVPFITRLHLILGASRQTWIEENGQIVAKSLQLHSFWDTGEIYLPALMHDQLLKGSMKFDTGMSQPNFFVGLLAEKYRCRLTLKLGPRASNSLADDQTPFIPAGSQAAAASSTFESLYTLKFKPSVIQLE